MMIAVVVAMMIVVLAAMVTEVTTRSNIIHIHNNDYGS
jgi:hypothetical protein